MNGGVNNMDTWMIMVGVTAMALIYFGERFKVGSYLWVGALFATIFALRMATPVFYIATAGLLGVLALRTFRYKEDVRGSDDE